MNTNRAVVIDFPLIKTLVFNRRRCQPGNCSGLLNLATGIEVICSSQNNTGGPMKKRNFSAEFKRESAQLVLGQNYTVAAAG